MNTFTFMIMLFPFIPIGIAALFCLKLKGEKRKEAFSRFKLVLACFVAVLGWFYFFEDKQLIFECAKETARCDYYHSTIADPELRFVKSYDFTKWTNIELQSFKRRSGRYSSTTRYKIVFHSGTEQEEFPATFSIKEWAEEEIGKINRFLKTDRKRYVYEEGSADQNSFSDGIRYSLILTTSVWLIWLLYDRKKERK